jgi:hypothetical protein
LPSYTEAEFPVGHMVSQLHISSLPFFSYFCLLELYYWRLTLLLGHSFSYHVFPIFYLFVCFKWPPSLPPFPFLQMPLIIPSGKRISHTYTTKHGSLVPQHIVKCWHFLLAIVGLSGSSGTLSLPSIPGESTYHYPRKIFKFKI